MMRNIFLCLIILTVPVIVSAQENPTPEQSAILKNQIAAVNAAQAWLVIVDEGRYSDSWGQSSGLFKSKVPSDQWIAGVGQIRSPLGQVISRELVGVQSTTEMPGAPSGKYMILQFKTSFEQKQDSVETVTPMVDTDGQWRVSGYYIK